jgi:hypothetical protein
MRSFSQSHFVCHLGDDRYAECQISKFRGWVSRWPAPALNIGILDKQGKNSKVFPMAL